MIMNEKLIEKHLFESTHQDVIKRINTPGMILSILLILAGIVILISSSQIGRVSAAITLTLMILGCGLLLFGIYWIIFKSKTLVFGPTGSKVIKNSVSFDIHELIKLERIIKSGSFSLELIPTNEKGSVRLDYMISEDGQFVAVQLFQFSTYKYTADIPITYFRGDKAEEAFAFLKQFNLEF
jgi:hypothetical protein